MSHPGRTGFDSVERGKGAQTPPPRPAPHSEGKKIDGCRSLPHHETSRRRFAPMAITIARES